jgi:tRNA modification GTPase
MALSDAVSSLFIDEKIKVGNEAILSSARHNASLTRALASVEAAISAYSSGVFTDAAASEVEGALSAIAEIDGRAVSEEIVRDIFSKFCVGK